MFYLWSLTFALPISLIKDLNKLSCQLLKLYYHLPRILSNIRHPQSSPKMSSGEIVLGEVWLHSLLADLLLSMLTCWINCVMIGYLPTSLPSTDIRRPSGWWREQKSRIRSINDIFPAVISFNTRLKCLSPISCIYIMSHVARQRVCMSHTYEMTWGIQVYQVKSSQLEALLLEIVKPNARVFHHHPM